MNCYLSLYLKSDILESYTVSLTPVCVTVEGKVIKLDNVTTALTVCCYTVYNGRLALYYLNAVSKGYQQANIDLKRKMQMVSMSDLLLYIISVCFILFPSFLKTSFVQDSIKQMTVWFIDGHFRLEMRKRTAGTTRTALIK